MCRRLGLGVCCTLLVWLTPVPAYSERLPLRLYTVADGLASDVITHIVQDSQGFLWFGTLNGLSRFDGYSFTNYTADQGLPSPFVTDVLEAGDGYWVGTLAGLARLSRSGIVSAVYAPKDGEASRRVHRVVRDRAGSIWVGTSAGLYRLEQSNGRLTFDAVDVGMPANTSDDRIVRDIFEDRSGSLWISTRGSGLYRRFADGHTEHYTTRNGLPWNRIEKVIEDRRGRLWVATILGLCLLVETPQENERVVERTYTTANGLAGNWVNVLFQSSDGTLWAGVTGGLTRFIPADRSGEQQFRSYTQAHGLGDGTVEALAEDRDGNLWIGTAGGPAKLVRDGFVTYGSQDGVHSIASVFEDRSGALTVFGDGRFGRFSAEGFRTIGLNLPRKQSWGSNQLALEDRRGEWWLPTEQGLYRFPRVSTIQELARTQPTEVYTARNGLPGDNIYHVYEDSRGDIWINTISGLQPRLTRWDGATHTFHRISESDGWRPNTWITAFAEDALGTLWISSARSGIARHTNGRFAFFTKDDGLPTNEIEGLYVDGRQRLWLMTVSNGVCRIDLPESDRPHCRHYTTADGLSSNETRRAVEDRWGRIYITTDRGVDRLDPDTGRVKHFTAADGLARGDVAFALRDRKGALWFGTNHELSRLVPALEDASSPLPVFVSAMHVSGRSQPIVDRDTGRPLTLELRPDQNRLTFEFFGVSFKAGERLTYQYRLEGLDRDWSDASNERTVNYASVPSGHHRFHVRAVSADGRMSESPASVAFTILPPMWRRWWFVASVAAAAAASAYALHRYRLGKLLEFERLRFRIATDLHDDIGASLSRVAILSEVVKTRVGGDDVATMPLLGEIASSARDLVGSMRDLVWAIDPRYESLGDVVTRVRQFASVVLDASGIHWQFNTAGDALETRLNPEQRRHVLLFFKEAINNIARHAQCRNVHLEIDVEGKQVMCTAQDDGRGLPAVRDDAVASGAGLRNMQARALQMNGHVSIRSKPGEGTTIRFAVPLRGRPTRRPT